MPAKLAEPVSQSSSTASQDISLKAEDPLVVLIEDDAGVCLAISGLLRSAGLQVHAFASVQEFLDGAPPRPPQCIILDVWLPGYSGLDFQATLTKAGARLPLIFISAHADVHMSVRAMKAGAFEFLTKPVRHQELLEAVRLAVTTGEPDPAGWNPQRLMR
jgi:FixJ family two-component response regulator